MPLKTEITLSVSATLSAALDLESATSQLAKKLLIALTDGSAANQATNMFSDTRTLVASATESLDLAGSLVNAFGATITFAKMRAIMIFAAATNTNDVVVGGAASNGFFSPFGAANNTVKVKPGGCLILIAPDTAGYAVTAATADLLQVANGGAGTPVTYDVILIGA
jgi:hypothetical protein